MIIFAVYFLYYEPQIQKERFYYRNSAIDVFEGLTEIIENHQTGMFSQSYVSDDFEGFVNEFFGVEYLHRIPYQREKMRNMVFIFKNPYFLWAAPSPIRSEIQTNLSSIDLSNPIHLCNLTYSPTNGINSSGDIFVWGQIVSATQEE